MNTAAKYRATSVLACLLRKWPADTPFDGKAFGSVTNFLRFAHSCYTSGTGVRAVQAKLAEAVESSCVMGNAELPSEVVDVAIRQLTAGLSTPGAVRRAMIQNFESLHPYKVNTDSCKPYYLFSLTEGVHN